MGSNPTFSAKAIDTQWGVFCIDNERDENPRVRKGVRRSDLRVLASRTETVLNQENV